MKSSITLDPEDVAGARDVKSDTGNNYIRVEMSINRLMRTFLKEAILKN